jgi:hypothetical protein
LINCDVGVFSKIHQEITLPRALVVVGLDSNEIKFKTFFTNCIQEALTGREYHQTEDDDWNVYWCEKEYIPETLDKIRLFPEKRINHFRNFYEICRKDLLSKNVKRYKKTLEREGKAEEAAGYDYLPLTYNLPSEYPIFLEEFKRSKEQKVVWIMKPVIKTLLRSAEVRARGSSSLGPSARSRIGQIQATSPSPTSCRDISIIRC